MSWGLALGAAVFAAFRLNDYRLFQLSQIATTAIAVAGLVLLTGHGGQFNAGQGAFFGLGAYTCAVFTATHGWAWPAAVAAGALAAGACGLLLGVPALRLGQMSLALITLSVAVLFPLVVARWSSVTGGPYGLAVPPVRSPAGLPLADAQFLYLVAITVLAAVLAVAARWARGRNGRALAALRTHPVMASAQGINTSQLIVLTVGYAATLAGLGGALNVLVLQSAIPNGYPLTLSLALLTAVVVGGVRSWAGAVAGTAYVVVLPTVSSDLVGSAAAGQWSQVCYAITLLLTVYLAPNGIAGLATSMRTALTRGSTGAAPPRVPEPTASQTPWKGSA